MVVADRLKVGMLHRVPRGDPLRVVVPQHPVEQVDRLIGHQLVILGRDELGPRLALVLTQDVVVVRVQLQLVLVDVGEQFLSAQDFGNFYELVIVVLTLEKGFLLEYHAGEHAAERPNVQRVIIDLQVDEELGALEIAGGDAHIVLLSRVVELGQTPVDEAQLAILVVDHNVVGLHIPVNHALRVAVVQRLQHFVDVVADVKIRERLVQRAEIHITRVHELHDECGRLGHRVPHHINQVDDVDATLQRLQDFDLSPDLRLLDYTASTHGRQNLVN